MVRPSLERSGWAECWGEATVSADITSPWGSLYRGSVSARSLPFAFAEPPHWQVWADGNGVLPLSGGSAAKDQLPAAYLVSPTSGQAVGCRVCWYAAGELETQGGELV